LFSFLTVITEKPFCDPRKWLQYTGRICEPVIKYSANNGIQMTDNRHKPSIEITVNNTVCKDDRGCITALKRQISERWYYLTAHQQRVNVLTSNITCVTCHLVKETFPPLPQQIKAVTWFSDPRGMQSWVDPVSLVTNWGGIPQNSHPSQY